MLPSLFHNQRAWEGHRVSLGHVGVLVDLLQPPDAAGAGEQTLRALGAGGGGSPFPSAAAPTDLPGAQPEGSSPFLLLPGDPGDIPGAGLSLGQLCGGMCQRQGGVSGGAALCHWLAVCHTTLQGQKKALPTRVRKADLEPVGFVQCLR